MIFTTERLLVRELGLEDYERFHLLQSSPDVMRYTGSLPQNKKESLQDLQRLIEGYNAQESTFLVWGIFDKETTNFIGTCALVDYEQKENWLEIGYRLLPTYWKKGYGSEITLGLIEHAFNDRKVEGIFAETDELNVASVKILEIYFIFLGKFVNEELGCVDYHYELNRKDYEKRRYSHSS